MSLRSLLTGISEVKIDIDNRQFVGRIGVGNQKPAWRCDTRINDIPTTGFGESPQEAVQNLVEFVKSRSSDNTSNNF